MPIRRKLNDEECIGETDYKGDFVENPPYEELFLGGCGGVMLRKRGLHDRHVCFTFLVEDDTCWHVGISHGVSSFWMNDYMEAMTEAYKWLEENATKTDWGWEFKNEKS